MNGEACQHLLFRKGGGLDRCGKPAKYEWLGSPVCARHHPEQQRLARDRRDERKMVRLVMQMENVIELLDKLEEAQS